MNGKIALIATSVSVCFILTWCMLSRIYRDVVDIEKSLLKSDLN